MCSAQRMVDMQRQDAIYLSQSEYCSAPPIGLELVHVCTTEKKIHDMRLSEEPLTAHYFVQSPEGDKESTISYEIGKRPVVKGAKNNSHYSKYMDWNLRVDSRPNLVGDRSGQLSEATANFVHSFIFKIDGEDCAETDTPSKEADGPTRRFKLPRWQTAAHGNLAQVSSNFRTKSCARLQYRDTPYEIQLSITQHWAKLPVSAKPDRLSWSVSVSSIHWEEALSECKSNKSSREFEGALLNRLWPGEGSLKERLKEFLECVFSIQTAIVELQS
ncbi:hypothetical protein MY4038_001345 [Beauveria bassiana]